MSDPVIRRVRRSIDEARNRGGMQAGMPKVTIDAADAERLCIVAEALTAPQPAEQQPVVPTIFADARLTADQQEKIASMLVNGVSAPEFCQHLKGVDTHAVNRWLKDKGWLFEGAGRYCNWKVTSYARDRYMTERAIEVSSSQGPFSVSKPVLLRKGARWLIYHYMQGRLPMKKTWDGVLEVAV